MTERVSARRSARESRQLKRDTDARQRRWLLRGADEPEGGEKFLSEAFRQVGNRSACYSGRVCRYPMRFGS